ncbi:ArsR/SmtB family transcription factor [Methylomonas sp. 2BW1-5-20]|jgi:DNA-binding transcriptional ArsR family regulator|uniref:ArsR/SmtB family transcription factor n=1 Tax=Methylomonas sp. 2BW1-5-20 TaxID=3376686 RepID=UPI00404F2D55
MARFVHPSKNDITLTSVLYALSDPQRINIIKKLQEVDGCMSCSDAMPCPDMPKSTLSHHFRILRESGLIRTEKKGVENRNVLRMEDINDRFPGLLKLILDLSE